MPDDAGPPADAATPATDAPALDSAADAWVLPGPLGPLTTRLELEARFGKENVSHDSVPGAEGIGTQDLLVIFPDEPGKRLELVQDADDPDAPLLELRVSGTQSRWRDGHGIRPGMSLGELVDLNGAPISFYGLGWDYGGIVQDWHGGRLANAVGAKVFHRVGLRARDEGVGKVPQGDASFRSDDPRYPDLGESLVVGELGISWPHDGED